MTPGTERPHDDGWMADAACRDQPAAWFTDPAGPAETRAAMATCANCLVRQPCLNTALALEPDVDIGIWGATTSEQRQLLRAGRRPDLQPTPRRTHRHRATVQRYTAPRLTVTRDAHGDFTDADRRVAITRLHDRDYILIVDGHVTARVSRLTDAQEIAWRQLHSRRRSAPPAPESDVRVRLHDSAAQNASERLRLV